MVSVAKKVIFVYFLFVVNQQVLAQTSSLYNEVSKLYDAEDYKAIIKRESAILAFVKDKTDTLATNLYFYLGDAYLKRNKLEKAILYFEKEREVWETSSTTSAEYANCLFNLTYVYYRANDIEKGKVVGTLLLDIERKLYGVNDVEYVKSLNAYVGLLTNAGQIDEAIRMLETALRETKEFTLANAIVLSSLADLYSYAGRYKASERLFIDAITLLKQFEGEDSEFYNTTLTNYGSLLMQMGKYDQAEEIYTGVLTLAKEKDWFTSNIQYATLNNLALVQNSLGLYDQSESSYRELMQLDSANIGVNHPDYAIDLCNLGLLYIDQGKLKAAEKVIKQAISIMKSNKLSNTVSNAINLNNLAKAYQRDKRYNDAIPLLIESQGIFEKSFGKLSPEYATATFNLGNVYLYQKSPKALPTLKSALDLRGKVLGKSHPLYAECEERIAQYHWMNNNKDETGKLYNNVFDNYYGQIDTFFPVLTEEEKSNFFYNKVKPSIESFASFVVSQSNDVQLLGRLFDYHVNTKGIILLATEKVRKSILSSKDSSLIQLYENWESSKDLLSYYYSIHESQQHIDSLVKLSSSLEKELTRKSASFAKNIGRTLVTWKNIQQKLKPGEAALECLRYRIYDPAEQEFGSKIGYAFLLLTSETKDGPVLINLETGKDMESRYLNYYRNGIKLKFDDLYTFKQYWEAIHDQLQKRNINKVFFSPDGIYNTININSIKNPFTNKYLIEEIDLRRVTSSVTLLEEARINNARSVGYLLGFPSYKVASEQIANQSLNTVANSGTRSFRGGMLRFLRNGQGITPLPGTKVEIDKISTNLKSHFTTLEVKLASEAIESQIKKISSPSIIHIATHGFFLDEEDGGALVKLPNPLLMSGLILAGAENFIQSGTNPLHINDDGILTAYEVMNMDLDNTELVVLSACETGLGKVQAGEGVYGLQRAFQVAGAQAIIMSLWSVDDSATQQLMTFFYDEYLKTNDLSASFRKAQLDLMKKYPQPFYWGAFVLVGRGD